MAPELRRTRHETTGTGQHDNRDTKVSTYGTRSSKRKMSEFNNPDSSPLGSKTSTDSSQSSLNEIEPISPPAKRTRKSSIAAPKTPEEEEIDQETIEAPLLTVDEASSVVSDQEEEPVQEAPTTPKRGGYRRRGRGGGRWGHLYRARGGRGNSSAASRSTPAAESSPSAPKGLRGRGGHRVKKSDNARIQALYHRRAALKHQYKQVAYFQKAALISMAEKSLETAKEDPNYHKTFEEYGKTTQALSDIYMRRFNQLFEEYEMKKNYLIDLNEKDQEYERSRYQVSCPPQIDSDRTDEYDRRL